MTTPESTYVSLWIFVVLFIARLVYCKRMQRYA
jgi:hypothetical protein